MLTMWVSVVLPATCQSAGRPVIPRISFPPENAPPIAKVVNPLPLLRRRHAPYRHVVMFPTGRGLKGKGALDEELRAERRRIQVRMVNVL